MNRFEQRLHKRLQNEEIAAGYREMTAESEFRKSRIPTFQTIEEEAAFWDTHSSEEFADELTPVEDVKFVKAQSFDKMSRS